MTMTTEYSLEPLIPRPQVAAFASLMEEKLRANDEKGGWDDCKPKWLLARACEEFAELVETLRSDDNAEPVRNALFLARYHLILASRCLNDIGHYAKVRPGKSTGSEAADVANFLMMFIDVVHRLSQEAGDASASR